MSHRRVNAERGGALVKVVVAVVVLAAIGALLPPFLTDGKCTAEFDATGREFEGLRVQLANPDLARAYLKTRGLAFRELTPEECAASPPPGVEYCGAGPLFIVRKPVVDPVCRLYRDDATVVQLLYNRDGKLTRVQTDMKPYKILSADSIGLKFYWAR